MLTTRIAWLLATGQASPLSILAVTFTNKAAKEMLTRLAALTPVNMRGMWIGTFHGLCNRMLRAHYRDAELPQLFQILDTQDQLALIKRMYRAHDIDDERYPPRELQWFIADREGGGAAARTPSRRATTSRAGRSSTTRCTTRCASARASSISPSSCCAATSCWRCTSRIREHYRRRFSHLLVDEFQDTNVLQYKWLRLLAGPNTAVFAVGDDDQSIYAFRGANVANMQHFERDFARPDAPVRLIKLEQNYRSHGHILDAANALIKQQRRRASARTCGRAKARASRCARSPRRATSTRRRSSSTSSGASPTTASRSTEIALLYRSNAQSRVLEHALFNAALPYRVYGGMRFFERAEVKHALAYLRLLAEPGDDGAFLRVVNFPPRGIGARTLEQLQEPRGCGGTSLWQAACGGHAGGQGGAPRSRRSSG